MGKDKKFVHPTHVVTLVDYDANKDDLITSSGEHNFVAPEINVVLSFSRGEKFQVLSTVLDWWILCRSLKTEKEGYIATVYCAPAKLSDDEEETEDKTSDVRFNLLYFPNASPPNKPNPVESANIFSIVTFWWMTKLIRTGYKRPLVDEDLWELREANKAKPLREKFEVHWSKELEKWKSSTTTSPSCNGDIDKKTTKKQKKLKEEEYKPSVAKALVRVLWFEFLVGALSLLFHDVLQFCAPVLLSKLITFVQSENPDGTWGYVYAVLLFLVVTGQSLFRAQHYNKSYMIGVNIRSALTAGIYKKMLKFNSDGRRNFTAGEMVNIMSVDLQKLQDLLIFLNFAWSAPLTVIVSIGLIYNQVGYSVFAGLGVIIIFAVFNICLSGQLKSLQVKQMKQTDLRVKLINEVLSGIRVLKLYAWEESFMAKIMGYRKAELKKLRKGIAVTQSLFNIMNLSPFISILLTFTVYSYIGNILTAEKAFVTINLYNIMQFPLTILPMLAANLMHADVAMKRISKYLKGDELDDSDVTEGENETENVITIKDGTYTWEDIESPVLKDVNLEIPRGSLTAIVGQVGCGKSSLLHALLGEITRVSGEVTFQGTNGYVAQLPWIQNKTLKGNVLFDKKYNKEKYDDVIHACALDADIDILPNGDETEIGEKGINLSGGQKQRVAIARAVYNNADVYLFDDPLSAVDAHVGNHIFQKVIGNQGLLKNKTRLFVTHNLSYLPSVDKIIVLKNNRIAEIGTYDELRTNGGDFSEILETYSTKEEEHIDENTDLDVTMPIVKMETDFNNSRKSPFKDSKDQMGSSVSQYSLNVAFLPELDTILEADETRKETKDMEKSLIMDEETETGRVNRAVFLVYIKGLGVIVFLMMILFQLGSRAILVGSRIWLAEWSSASNLTSSQRDFYVGIYAAMGGGNALSLFIYLICMLMGIFSASRILHDDLLHSILRAPVKFFDTTPLGRIVNRFSKDIDIMDNQLPKSLNFVLDTMAGTICAIFAIAYSTPIFLAAFFPIGILFFIIQRFYVASSRQLRRIESVRRSPIFNHFLESINGATTIRAFGKSEKFLQDNEMKVDYNQMATIPWFDSNRWLSLRLEFCGNLITLFAAIFAIEQRNSISPGIAGMSISYALQVTLTMMWMVRSVSELEVNIIAVERIKNYIETPSEAPRVIKDTQPGDDWPSCGIVKFDNYSTRYREGLDLVLKDLTFTTKESEKIGIVGRTGSGKSTIALALFRIIEPVSGSISIDGMDIGTLGLKDLRSKLSIIPQDPVLFSGTIRSTLDPFSIFSDHEIWHALEVANLKPFVEEHDTGLEYLIEEGGLNLSVGQRQLVCLARAVLRKSKILIMDEATAAVDMETDAMIQQTIKEEFKNCTVFTIAHRLNTIIDYDRILVLEQGAIGQFDSPANLLRNIDGTFYKMAKDAGIVGAS